MQRYNERCLSQVRAFFFQLQDSPVGKDV